MSSNARFSPHDIDAALAAGILEADAAERLKGFLAAREPSPSVPVASTSRFDLTHVLWYAGALIIMSAMGLFSTLAFSAMGGAGLAATGIVYGLGLWVAGHRLWQRAETRTPGGLLISAAISMVPLIVFGVQSAADLWPGSNSPGQYRSFFHYIKAGWIPMELATLVVALIAIRRYPFTFIAFPAAVCLWFLSMDLAAWIAKEEGFNYTLRRQVSLAFGVALMLATWLSEVKARSTNYGFWLHLVAAITLWGGLTFQSSNSEWGKLAYCLINIGLIGLSVFLGRRVYAVFGVMGVMIYLGHLAYEVFQDSWLFPFALSAIGIGVVGLGIAYARRQRRIQQWFEARLPTGVQTLRPAHARRVGLSR